MSVLRTARPATAGGDDVDIAIAFHGVITPATASLLIKALEPHQPMLVEEPCEAQNHDVMAENRGINREKSAMPAGGS